MRHNYLRKLSEIFDAGIFTETDLQPGTVSELRVCHDDWCAIFTGGECNCDPDFEFGLIEVPE